MVEEVANSPMEERRRGEVRGTHLQMHGSEHFIEKILHAIHRSSSSDARPVCINGSVSTFFTEKEPTETQEPKPSRANLDIQSANDGRPRAKKKRAASRSSSALGQEKAARPRNVKTFQLGAKEKGAARKNGAIRLSDLYFGVAIWTVLAGPAGAATLKQTRQSLPPDCLQLLSLHYDDCPDRADPIFVPLWNNLNNLCCSDYPGIFHCQFKNEGGTTYSVPACLQNQTIPIGKLGLLNIKDGYPELDPDLDCPSGTFRGHPVDSTFIRHWYCDSTKAKEEAGEEKWCDGGPSADDLFICRIGYYAENCPHGRNNSHDACPCLPVQFRNGSEPFRNVTGTCNSSINVIYGTAFPVSTSGMSTSTPSYQLSSSVSGDGEINSTTPWITKPDSNSSSHYYGFLGPVLGVTVALAVFGLVFFCYWKPTRNSDLLEQEKMMADSGSSSKDDSITLDMSSESE